MHGNFLYIRRDIEEPIIKHIKSESDAVLLLSGARQTGKSTLIENIDFAMDKFIINLWDEEPEVVALREARNFSEFESRLTHLFGFRPYENRILIIDEAQAASHLASFLMELHRKWKGQKIVLLGSILSNLFQSGTPMPTGRTLELTCRPLHFGEFLRFRAKDKWFDLLPDDLESITQVAPEVHAALMAEYELFLQIGGLPGIVLSHGRGEDFKLLLESLLANMYRDADRYIGQQAGGSGKRVPQYGSLLEHVLRSVAMHTGQPTQNSSILSTDSPAYRNVLPRVLEALKYWHIVYFLSYETAQLTTKKGYSSKKYLLDTGMTNYLINRFLPVRFGGSTEVVAKLLESAVLQDLLGFALSIRFVTSYKSNNRLKNELDFVASLNDQIVPVEVKSSNRVNQKSLSQLLAFMEHRNVDQGIVIFTGMPQKQKIEKRTIWYLPPYALAWFLSGLSR
ncbi:MAG: ATP-binding protein [Deltaproteobacteria bacterium]|nr:ATP-binding protein [Deltaproteobacteria bacterium]